MCGLAGGTRTTPDALAAMAARLRHRGPDDAGTWFDPESGAGLTHTRLAVIDLSPRAAQPMASADGRYRLAFNGEIYNFRELRAALAAAGERFRSDSDTEVLLRLLMREGEAALDRLVGMFAFALWDGREKSLLLARDRLGIKPLVYAPLDGGHLAFASEIRALSAHPGVDRAMDREALSDYLACLYVPAPRTICAGIRKLAPGHLLRWSNGKAIVRRWWQVAFAGGRAPSVDEAAEALEPVVRQAVAARRVADVPVGCFLSGGIDSSVIAALMAREAAAAGAPPVRTFTMTFDQPAYDERRAAARVAAHVGAVHTELAASPALTGRLDALVAAFGEPFGNPTALLIDDLSRKAREHVTVALVGDGGDEVFAGYPRYAGGRLAARYRAVPHSLRIAAAAAAALIPESTRGRHGWRRAREFLAAGPLAAAEAYAAWTEYFDPPARRALLGLDHDPERPLAAVYRRCGRADPLDAMQQTDLETFLPGNLLAYGDAMSMAHALELRLPLIDHRLVEAVAGIDAAVRMAAGKKTLLKAVARRLLPAAIVERPKRGFNPPMGVWLATDLAGLVAERLTPDAMAACGLEWPAVAALLETWRRGRRDVALPMWSLLVLDAWRRSR